MLTGLPDDPPTSHAVGNGRLTHRPHFAALGLPRTSAEGALTSPAQFSAAPDLLETHGALKVTLTDALLAAMSAGDQAEVVTFDAHLGVLGARVWDGV